MNRDWELAERRAKWSPGLCRWCLGPVAPPRQTYCGATCVHEWKMRSSASYARSKVKKRDRGVCAGCGAVCGDGSWEADHVVALEEGGTGAMSNLQTLCSGRLRGCHYEKTREHARRRAERRRNPGSESGAASEG